VKREGLAMCSASVESIRADPGFFAKGVELRVWEYPSGVQRHREWETKLKENLEITEQMLTLTTTHLWPLTYTMEQFLSPQKVGKGV